MILEDHWSHPPSLQLLLAQLHGQQFLRPETLRNFTPRDGTQTVFWETRKINLHKPAMCLKPLIKLVMTYHWVVHITPESIIYVWRIYEKNMMMAGSTASFWQFAKAQSLANDVAWFYNWVSTFLGGWKRKKSINSPHCPKKGRTPTCSHVSTSYSLYIGIILPCQSSIPSRELRRSSGPGLPSMGAWHIKSGWTIKYMGLRWCNYP